CLDGQRKSQGVDLPSHIEVSRGKLVFDLRPASCRAGQPVVVDIEKIDLLVIVVEGLDDFRPKISTNAFKYDTNGIEHADGQRLKRSMFDVLIIMFRCRQASTRLDSPKPIVI